jgi:hypothetical protein
MSWTGREALGADVAELAACVESFAMALSRAKRDQISRITPRLGSLRRFAPAVGSLRRRVHAVRRRGEGRD